MRLHSAALLHLKLAEDAGFNYFAEVGPPDAAFTELVEHEPTFPWGLADPLGESGCRLEHAEDAASQKLGANGARAPPTGGWLGDS
jgi:hypothetical protein